MYHQKYTTYKAKYILLKNMKTSYDSLLETDKSHVFVNLNLSNDDKQVIKSLSVKNQFNFSYFGFFHPDQIKKSITKYLIKVGNDPIISQKSASVILKIIKSYLIVTDKEYLWFDMRSSNPNNFFDMPRWHVDGPMYNPEYYIKNDLPQFKLAGVLIGPTTLFKLDNKEMLESYREAFSFAHKNFDKSATMEKRKFINDKLDKYESHQPANDEASIFIVSSKNKSAVHSEPPVNKDRIFYSVVSGTRDEILDLTQHWNESFVD